MNQCEPFKPLIIGLMDGELTEPETAEVNQHLIRCEDCRNEYENLQSTTAHIKQVSFKEPEDEMLEKLWRFPFSRFTTFSGLFLVVAGWLSLVAYGVYEYVMREDEFWFPQVGSAAVFVGFVILLFVVIRERISTYKVDAYKGVKR